MTGSAPAQPRSSAKDPSAALAAALSARELEAASACFARDACLITPDATVVRTRQSIRQVLHQLIAMGSRAEVEQHSMLVAGEVAIATETWTMRFEGADGAPFARSADSSSVLRRLEGTWKLQIAAPWGWG